VVIECHREGPRIWGIIKNHHGHLYRLGGVNDHIHILSDLHPSVALGDYIKNIKVASHEWIEKEGHMRSFPGWQTGYGGYSHNIHEKERLTNYIKGQETHHEKVSFRDELIALLREAGIEFDEKYLD
jgi:REP element-mobilizing transposase RayT